ncbi:MAG TPA: DUF1289 domain-containing protein [Nevskiaceae bacterium]|nr:DUF1289 domain-containing protein [Nevskiaceae bacterium]
MIESPCIKVCQLDAQQVCVGCGRSLDEIAQWSTASEVRQRQIVEVARQRLAIIARRPAGTSPDSSEPA